MTIFQAELEEKDEIKSEEPVIEQPFQQLFISCPDGLNIRYMLESHVGRYSWNYIRPTENLTLKEPIRTITDDKFCNIPILSMLIRLDHVRPAKPQISLCIHSV